MGEFGKLNKVELREHWKDEAGDFTPWLAKEENLTLLGEAISMDLELVGSEQSAGDSDFKVDILARDINTDQYVVIENQLEKTDHDHLGKLLTYAAGHSAKAVVWVSDRIREEHRKALDWLNEKTVEGVGFFGLEVELWRIGESKAAPKFNVVSQPNDWAKGIAKSDSHSELTKTQVFRQRFWTEFVEYMKEHKTSLPKLQEPSPYRRYKFGLGKSGFWISLTIYSRPKQISCKLFIKDSQSSFMKFRESGEEIEAELGAQLKWESKPNKKNSQIVQYHPADFQNEEKWPELFAWFKERSEAFYKVFHKRVQNLDWDEEAA